MRRIILLLDQPLQVLPGVDVEAKARLFKNELADHGPSLVSAKHSKKLLLELAWPLWILRILDGALCQNPIAPEPQGYYYQPSVLAVAQLHLQNLNRHVNAQHAQWRLVSDTPLAVNRGHRMSWSGSCILLAQTSAFCGVSLVELTSCGLHALSKLRRRTVRCSK